MSAQPGKTHTAPCIVRARDDVARCASPAGGYVIMLTTRLFGFSLDGVPDGPRTLGRFLPPIVVRVDHGWNR